MATGATSSKHAASLVLRWSAWAALAAALPTLIVLSLPGPARPHWYYSPTATPAPIHDDYERPQRSTPTLTPTPALPPPPLPDAHAAFRVPGLADAVARCYQNPERYAWRAYASAYDWPLDEVARVVAAESGGDLCAVNAQTGAACWFQILSAEPYLPRYINDPHYCVAIAYAKWLDGGRNFTKHWYRWWSPTPTESAP